MITSRMPKRCWMPRRLFIWSATCLSGLTLIGCQLPGGGKAPRRIALTPAESFPPSLPSVAWALQINEPTATLSLNTARIAIGTRNDIKYVAGGEWASRAPEMVMELLANSFRNSNKILTVGDRRARIRPDFVLELRLTQFHIEKTAQEAAIGTVRVQLDVSLVKRPRRDALASTSFESSSEVESLTLDNIVAAFDESLVDVMEQVVEWTLVTGANAA